jgi:hypothetical protein
VTTSLRPLDDLTDTSPRDRWNRHRRAIIAALAAVVIVGAFLLWGPIGLGNGPLRIGQNGAEGWTDSADAPAALSLPTSYSGHDPVVIDGVGLVGVKGYPVPRIIALEVLATPSDCGGIAPERSARRGFGEAGCSSRVRGPLLGTSFSASHPLTVAGGLTAAAELAAPRPGTCWAFAEVAVRYHVGIRHFTATGPVGEAACATRDTALAEAAMDAVAAGS